MGITGVIEGAGIPPTIVSWGIYKHLFTCLYKAYWRLEPAVDATATVWTFTPLHTLNRHQQPSPGQYYDGMRQDCPVWAKSTRESILRHSGP